MDFGVSNSVAANERRAIEGDGLRTMYAAAADLIWLSQTPVR